MQPSPLPDVLVVDDNQDNANIIRQYLSAVWGYRVLVAHNGDEAMDIFDVQHPQIVLLDVMMPGRDGWEICRLMKEHPFMAARVRIIMVTALDDLADKRRALQTGADDFVEKPFDLAKLAATVNRNVAALAQSAA